MANHLSEERGLRVESGASAGFRRLLGEMATPPAAVHASSDRVGDLYFVLVGERRFTEFEGVLAPASSPTDSLAARIARLSGQATKPGDIEFATRAALEVEALRLQYVEANTLILSRAPAS